MHDHGMHCLWFNWEWPYIIRKGTCTSYVARKQYHVCLLMSNQHTVEVRAYPISFSCFIDFNFLLRVFTVLIFNASILTFMHFLKFSVFVCSRQYFVCYTSLTCQNQHRAFTFQASAHCIQGSLVVSCCYRCEALSRKKHFKSLFYGIG